MELLGESSEARLSHTIFRFESTMGFGISDRLLITQLSMEVGYPLHGFPEKEGQPDEARVIKEPQLWRYLTGEAREMLDDFPELQALRDIVFLLKAFMAPNREDLPPYVLTICPTSPLSTGSLSDALSAPLLLHVLPRVCLNLRTLRVQAISISRL